ncbi:MAG: hypothetical protein P8N56_03910 [Schleiferiaceae bacterium]|nr:hypothetical protein [Schleiferiaceae bacterium]
MNRLSLLFLVSASTFLASCGAWRKAPIEIALETPPPPRSNEAIVLEALKSQYEALASDSLFYRAKGSAQVDYPGSSQKARLEVRISTEPNMPLVWLDIADPFIGLKLARVQVTVDSAQGYAHIVNKVLDEPISRLADIGLPASTWDLINLLTAQPIALPTTIVGMNLSASSDGTQALWTVVFPVQRGEHLGRLTLVMTQQAPHRLISQELSIEAIQARAGVEYAPSGAWTARFKGAGTEGKLQFEPSQSGWQEASLTFPFTLPSGYARVEL